MLYFHWLLDIISRIKLLELAKINFQTIDFFLVDNRTQFQKQTLKKFNILPHQIIPLSFPINLKAEQLIVPSFARTLSWMPSWACDYLQQKFLPSNIEQKNYKKEFILVEINPVIVV